MHCTVQRARTALHYTVHSTRAALYTYRRIVRIVHIPYTVRTVQPRDYRPRGTIREGALLFSAREWLDFYSGGASIRGGLLFARIRYSDEAESDRGRLLRRRCDWIQSVSRLAESFPETQEACSQTTDECWPENPTQCPDCGEDVHGKCSTKNQRKYCGISSHVATTDLHSSLKELIQTGEIPDVESNDSGSESESEESSDGDEDDSDCDIIDDSGSGMEGDVASGGEDEG